jgi:hypothetical protein
MQLSQEDIVFLKFLRERRTKVIGVMGKITENTNYLPFAYYIPGVEHSYRTADKIVKGDLLDSYLRATIRAGGILSGQFVGAISKAKLYIPYNLTVKVINNTVFPLSVTGEDQAERIEIIRDWCKNWLEIVYIQPDFLATLM